MQSRAGWNITKLDGCGLCVCVLLSGKIEKITWQTIYYNLVYHKEG